MLCLDPLMEWQHGWASGRIPFWISMFGGEGGDREAGYMIFFSFSHMQKIGRIFM